MTNPIVNVNVNIIAAPTPNTLQAKGAIISQGATNLEPGESQLLTTQGDLANIAIVPLAITSLTWNANAVTVVTVAPHGIPNGNVIPVVIAGAAPVAYNGTFEATSTGGSTFTYPLASNPGAETVPGTWVLEDSVELNAQVRTFFGQGSSQAVYVLELGEGDPADGVAFLNTYINAQPSQPFYRYLVPRGWADETTFLPFLTPFEKTTGKTYFHVTVTQANQANFTPLMKCVYKFIESPDADPTAEFGSAWPFYDLLSLNPGPTNKVTPNAFDFGFGITPFPVKGNNALFATLKAANVNWAGTGAEGGLSNVILFYGVTADGRDGSYWYGVDWVQIQVDEAISNAVFNGSNNKINPLYYNQDGINRLQQVAVGVLSSAITFGMLVGTVKATALTGPAFDANLSSGLYDGLAVINAIPFTTYVSGAPSDYPAGIYNGFAVVCSVLRGFISITFTINVTDFVAQ